VPHVTHTVNVRLRDDQEQPLRERAAQEGRSVDAVLVALVDEYLARPARDAVIERTAAAQADKWRELLERLK
jgi:hypothetical protein